ncbi:LysR family transcriptional regulator [Arthrobacter nitrophenolicus]|uniref:LysR family transcriptional regulator n=1 Tax=Arthrobacter nitrophenolicus TaxID=683150 RepID=A0A4R5Y944_9MICC|nr:LysR family transcriptional regulator [Arthrobacter nitrophenolicus]TDL39642.1 LysR family transcriptional regulator [Arthrobacter nitrophenolicus]
MDLRELQTFRAVAEMGSLTRASDRLHIAQPALSRQIRLLEAELRTALFTRDGRGMRLTPAGEVLLERSAGLMRDVDRMRDDLRSFLGAPTGYVHVGLLPTVSAMVSGAVARRVLHELPAVTLRMSESYSGHLVDWLHRGDLDVAVLYGPSEALHMPTQSLGHESLVAVAASGEHLGNLAEMELSRLLAEPLALPSANHGIRRIIDDAAERAKYPVRVLMEADSFRILVNVAVQGLAVTVLPKSAVRREIEAGTLTTARIVSPALDREVIMAWAGNGPPSVAASAVTSILREEVLSAFGFSGAG